MARITLNGAFDTLGLLGLGIGGLLVTASCGGGATSQRYVDSPVGVSHQYGTPKNTSYSAEVLAEKDVLRLIVFKQSECDRIRVRIVSRTEETIQDGEVINRDPIGPVQVADGSDGIVACGQGYARDVRVSLKVGTSDHVLGRTNPTGELAVNLSAELKQSLYGESAPTEAALFVEGQQLNATVSLLELKKHEERVSSLLQEMEALLVKDQTEWSHEELAHSYVLFEQLRTLDRGDARISALLTRFLELTYGRKQIEATNTLKRNLDALKSAKELLAAGAQGVPMFVQIAVQDGATSNEALRWARGQVLVGVRSRPAFCQSAVTWTRIEQESWQGPTKVSFAYLRYANDDPFLQEVQGLCSGMGR